MASTDTPGATEHPNDDLLLALNDGVLFSGDRPLVEAHLKGCPRCRARLTALTEDITPTAPPAPEPPPDVRPKGALFGKLLAAIVALGLVAGVGIFAQREYRRRSAEPLPLASAPATPEPTPVPTIRDIPEPPTAAADAPPTEIAPADPAVPAEPAAPGEAPTAQPPAAAAAPEALALVAPDRNFRWRVVGRDVQRSTDGGNAWVTQEITLTRPVTAGAAPSAAVCWLVGRGGLVVTALGAIWRDVSLKEPLDLVRVAALDSMNATVTAANGRQFSTSDAGRTWIPLQP